MIITHELATLMWQVDDRVAFSHGDQDSPTFFYLSVHDWYDMGKPKTIKITAEPVHG